MLILLTLMLLLIIALPGGSDESSAASPGDEIIPADRRIDWKVGIPGGIPADRHVWKSVTDPPYNADPTGSDDSTSAFNQALADMPEHHVLYVPAGAYRLDSSIEWHNKGNNKTLRGAGPGLSKLLFYGGLIKMGPASTETRTGLDLDTKTNGLSVDADLSQDAAKGESHVHLSSLPSWVKAGHLYIIDQLDDPSFVRNGGSEGSQHPREGTGNGPRGLGQVVKITSTQQNGPADYQVNFEIPLYYGFKISQQAQIAMAGYDTTSAAPLSNCGIEDLYLEGKHAFGWSRGHSGHFFRMDSCMHCWVKNIEGYNVPANCHIWASFCYGLEVRDSYFHDSHAYSGGEAYGVALYNDTSACLVENNIFKHLHCPMMACYGASGNVFAYNYILEGAASSGQFCGLSTHATHAYMNLWEGNNGDKALADWTHGSSSHNTLLRNKLRGCDPGGRWDQSAVHIAYYNRKWNVLGNILGTAGYHTVYEHSNGESDDPSVDRVIYRLGYSLDKSLGNPCDDPATMDLIRHGNWDAVTRSVKWDPNIAGHDLPRSYYLSGKPAFFGDLPWPAYGPDVPGSETNKMPAQVRYASMISAAKADGR